MRPKKRAADWPPMMASPAKTSHCPPSELPPRRSQLPPEHSPVRRPFSQPASQLALASALHASDSPSPARRFSPRGPRSYRREPDNATIFHPMPPLWRNVNPDQRSAYRPCDAIFLSFELMIPHHGPHRPIRPRSPSAGSAGMRSGALTTTPRPAGHREPGCAPPALRPQHRR